MADLGLSAKMLLLTDIVVDSSKGSEVEQLNITTSNLGVNAGSKLPRKAEEWEGFVHVRACARARARVCVVFAGSGRLGRFDVAFYTAVEARRVE